MADLKHQIRTANADFIRAFSSHDAQALADLYSPSGMVFPPGSDALQGREAILRFWQGVMNTGITAVDLETVSVEGDEVTAIEIGRAVLHAGETVADRGKYLVVWKHESGAWRLYRDIWNSSTAQTASA